MSMVVAAICTIDECFVGRLKQRRIVEKRCTQNMTIRPQSTLLIGIDSDVYASS